MRASLLLLRRGARHGRGAAARAESMAERFSLERNATGRHSGRAIAAKRTKMGAEGAQDTGTRERPTPHAPRTYGIFARLSHRVR